MATVAYILFHDGGKRNISLLTQMKQRDKLKYLSTADEIHPNNLLRSECLVMMQIGSEGGRYIPKLGNSHRRENVSFRKWWEREPIVQSGKGNASASSLTRKRLVYALRNKDGGAHFDPIVEDQDYMAAQESTWIVHHNGKEEGLLRLETTSMRQIAFEILETLRGGGLIA